MTEGRYNIDIKIRADVKSEGDCLLPRVIKNLWIPNTVIRIRLKCNDRSSTLVHKEAVQLLAPRC